MKIVCTLHRTFYYSDNANQVPKDATLDYLNEFFANIAKRTRTANAIPVVNPGDLM